MKTSFAAMKESNGSVTYVFRMENDECKGLLDTSNYVEHSGTSFRNVFTKYLQFNKVFGLESNMDTNWLHERGFISENLHTLCRAEIDNYVECFL